MKNQFFVHIVDNKLVLADQKLIGHNQVSLVFPRKYIDEGKVIREENLNIVQWNQNGYDIKLFHNELEEAYHEYNFFKREQKLNRIIYE
jgi:hypothetical protein